MTDHFTRTISNYAPSGESQLNQCPSGAGVRSTNAGMATILSISPIEDDHAILSKIFNGVEGSGFPGLKLVLAPFSTVESAMAEVRKRKYPVVVCERDLKSSTWKEVLAELIDLPDSPLLIVTSRLADEKLWAEALNLGAHDVLVKPFNASEVLRVVTLASQRWSRSISRRKPLTKERHKNAAAATS